jgi:4-diphosphocytidyl-2C-methyl-D-erythritol kinase
LAGLTNDLEAPAILKLRATADTSGCLLARMIGSGARYLGLFANAPEAEVPATAFARPGR